MRKSLKLCMTVFLLFFALAVNAQTKTVKGHVTDASGEPVIGATIKVVGTKTGTVTDVDGNYSINCTPDATLEVSYIGSETQKVKVAGKGSVDVALKSADKTLDEVVVVGYGVQKKVNVTGSVSMVGEEAMKSRPVANATQALQGAIPGLNLTVNSSGGMLDNTMSMNIRGTGSINGSDNPLVLIDGVEGDINTLNPQDIESVSVLKDAAAASIYGARAAFGVILVTTKSGKEGKVNVTYSGDVRFATATQLPDMVNSLDFANYWNYASRNSGGSNVFSDETMEKMQKFANGQYTDPSQPEYYGTSYPTGSKGLHQSWGEYGSAFANTNWFDEFYKKNVPSTQHNLSISGGTEKLNYLVSGSFLKNQGLIRHGHDELDRYNVNAKIGAQLASWARIDFNTRWARQHYTKPTYMNGLFFHNIARRWPTCFVTDPNGYWADGMEVAELEDGGEYNTYSDDLTNKMRFTFTPIKGWNIVAEGAIRTQNEKYTTNWDPVYHYMADGTKYQRNSGTDWGNDTYYKDERYRLNYYAVNVFTNYTHTWADKHNFTALVGMNFEKYDTDDMYASGTTLTMASMPYLSQATANIKASDSYYHRAVAGYFGRLNYDFAGRYLVEVNLRYDGSSRFLAAKRWAWFPSFSLGWNIAREKWFENLNTGISTLKIRGSWGKLGNTTAAYSSFSDYYPFYQQQSIGMANGSWLINGTKQNTASLPSIINTELTWEKITTLDFGLDFSAFNGRLNASFDWFNRTTKDMVGPAPVLGSVLGANSPNTNNCDMQTRGWEFEISWRDKIAHQVGYNVRVNISDSKSKILKYPYTGDFENQSISSYYDGKELGEIWGYESVGLAQSQSEMDEWLKSNKPNWGSNWQAGDVMYKDINGDGAVTAGAGTLKDPGDKKVIGNTTPRYRIGINLGLDWKGIDFSVFFQGVLKRDWAFGPGDPYFWGAQGNMWQSCCFAEHLDCWSEDNPDAYYPRPYLTGGIQKNQQYQTRYLQNAAYLRCKNMQLGYTLPTKWTKKAAMSNVRIYGSVDNLFTITKLSKVFDPEVIEGLWNSGKTYPLQRTWSVGVSITFEGTTKKAVTKEIVYQPQYIEKVVEKPVTKEVVKEVVKEVNVNDKYLVTFAQSSDKIGDTSALDGIKAGQSVEVVAYASPEGSKSFNEALSQRRADAVAKYLEAKGVKVTRTIAKGADSDHANRIAVVTVK